MTSDEVDKVYQISKMLINSMISGIMIFAAVAWFLRDSGSMSDNAAPIDILIYVLIGLAFASAAVVFVLRQRMLSTLEEPGAREQVRSGQLTPAYVQTQTLIMWALIEGPALMGIVIYLLGGPQTVLLATLGYVAVAAVVLFPRREWFDLFRETPR